MVRMCHRTGPDGIDIEYPCPDSLVVKYGNLFMIKIGNADPELAAHFAKSIENQATLHIVAADQGVTYTAEGFSEPKAITVLTPLSPNRSSVKVAEFLKNLPDGVPTSFDVQ